MRKRTEKARKRNREKEREIEEEEAVMKCHNLPVILQMASWLFIVLCQRAGGEQLSVL